MQSPTVYRTSGGRLIVSSGPHNEGSYRRDLLMVFALSVVSMEGWGWGREVGRKSDHVSLVYLLVDVTVD